MKTRHTAYTVKLLAPSTPDDPDGIRRLRRWLKASWRSYALRCTDIGLAVTSPQSGKADTVASSEAIGLSVVPEDSNTAGGNVEA